MLAIVVKKNPYFRTGSWVDCTDQGCIRVDVESRDNRLHIVREVGFIMPKAEVLKYVMRPKVRGLDK
jgi:hypothetical protein